jgi:hypothetical protein
MLFSLEEENNAGDSPIRKQLFYYERKYTYEIIYNYIDGTHHKLWIDFTYNYIDGTHYKSWIDFSQHAITPHHYQLYVMSPSTASYIYVFIFLWLIVTPGFRKTNQVHTYMYAGI